MTTYEYIALIGSMFLGALLAFGVLLLVFGLVGVLTFMSIDLVEEVGQWYANRK